MTPYVRCKQTDEVIMARGSDVHVDHINEIELTIVQTIGPL